MSGLNVLENGKLADAEKVNENFTYLNGRISSVNGMVVNLQSTLINYINDTLRTTLSIYQDVNVLETSGTIALTDNSTNSITPTGSVTFTLPTISDNTKFHQMLVQMYLADATATGYVTGDSLGSNVIYANGVKPTFINAGYYDIVYEYNSIAEKWSVGVTYIGTAS